MAKAFSEALIPGAAFFEFTPEVFDPAPDTVEVMNVRIAGQPFGVGHFQIADMLFDLDARHLA
jgi:hypothetical protein